MDEGGKKGGRDGGRKKERFLNGYGILLPAGLSLKKKKRKNKPKKKKNPTKKLYIILSLFFFVKLKIMKAYGFITENQCEELIPNRIHIIL